MYTKSIQQREYYDRCVVKSPNLLNNLVTSHLPKNISVVFSLANYNYELRNRNSDSFTQFLLFH